MCDWECPGYAQEPHVGRLWPGESEADFGYPVDDVGTKRRTTQHSATAREDGR